MSNNYNYINPLGDVIDISYNSISKIKDNTLTRNAQLDDSKKKNKSYNFQLIIWSIVAGLFILILAILLRKVKDF